MILAVQKWRVQEYSQMVIIGLSGNGSPAQAKRFGADERGVASMACALAGASR